MGARINQQVGRGRRTHKRGAIGNPHGAAVAQAMADGLAEYALRDAEGNPLLFSARQRRHARRMMELARAAT